MRSNDSLVELHELFEIEHGNKFDLNKMDIVPPSDDAAAFVRRSGVDNGIGAFVRRSSEKDPFPAGLITVALGGAVLASFVQPRPFYTAQNIDVLKPRSEMSLDVRLYYCLCIEANRFRYSTFGREANRTLKSLLLPKQAPNWVHGVAKAAVEELRSDLFAALENR
jgi:Type I restriction modification DNA specificity domain